MAKGAFAQTIQDWASSGNTVPILYGHNAADPYMNVAAAVDLSEDDHGLLVHGKFDDAPAAEQVYSLVKSRRLSQLSFAYDTIDQGPVEVAGGEKANELRQVRLYEVSLVPVGANQTTEILAIKSAPTNRAATQTLALRLRILTADT
ncbi:HK97 family phage prohead protease [Diaminobutyricibacter sp. McL0608]|uniref:HK97 family phage prohead protease n=1 Tax=Leifsonia sp. McL0608 TaxID=3143537 RepID=UPI0031F2FF6B